jgi:hypothetical protein
MQQDLNKMGVPINSINRIKITKINAIIQYAAMQAYLRYEIWKKERRRKG